MLPSTSPSKRSAVLKGSRFKTKDKVFTSAFPSPMETRQPYLFQGLAPSWLRSVLGQTWLKTIFFTRLGLSFAAQWRAHVYNQRVAIASPLPCLFCLILPGSSHLAIDEELFEIHLKKYPVDNLLRPSTPLNEKQKTVVLVDHLENYIAKEHLPLVLKMAHFQMLQPLIVPICADCLAEEILKSYQRVELL